MESKTLKPMTPFDNLVTPPSVYALKLMLPYTPASMQRMLGLFLKFLEFQYTMKHFYGFGSEKSPSDALTALKDLMSPEEQDMMEQMEMMMNMMEMMQDMPDTADIPGMFGDMFGNALHPSDSDGHPQENKQEGDSQHE